MKKKSILMIQLNELREELESNSRNNREKNLENRVDIDYILMRLVDIMEG